MKNTRSILLLVILIVILFLSLPLPLSRDLKSSLIEFVSPLLKVTNRLAAKIVRGTDFVFSCYQAGKENARLRQQVIVLTETENILEEVKAENLRLKKILDLKLSLPYESVVCRVIGRDASSWYNTLIIDQGQKAGLRVAMPVLAAGGVVGRIISCQTTTATVLLITDINSSIGGLIRDTRTVGLVVGEGDYQCIFDLIPKQAELFSGAVVVTSGLGDIFPKGLLIGRITDRQAGMQGLYQTARIELAADFDRIEEVLVLKTHRR